MGPWVDGNQIGKKKMPSTGDLGNQARNMCGKVCLKIKKKCVRNPETMKRTR